jgi:hypothetical protein
VRRYVEAAQALEHECHHCHEKFVWENNLRRHLRVHSASTMFTHECKHCGALFSRPDSLQRHTESQKRCAGDSVLFGFYQANLFLNENRELKIKRPMHSETCEVVDWWFGSLSNGKVVEPSLLFLRDVDQDEDIRQAYGRIVANKLYKRWIRWVVKTGYAYI